MKINQILTVENFSAPTEIELVKQEAAYLLNIMEADPNFALTAQFEREISPISLFCFFRHRERTEKVCQIMQYLLSFLDHIPTNDEIRGEPINPTEQFRSFLHYQADLLLEEDVKNAVFNETNHNTNANASGTWDFQERIVTTNHRIKGQLAAEAGNVAGDIANHCFVLEQLSLFWFDVRHHDLRRARRSDILMYLLAQLVRNRCQQTLTA